MNNGTKLVTREFIRFFKTPDMPIHELPGSDCRHHTPGFDLVTARVATWTRMSKFLQGSGFAASIASEEIRHLP